MFIDTVKAKQIQDFLLNITETKILDPESICHVMSENESCICYVWWTCFSIDSRHSYMYQLC